MVNPSSFPWFLAVANTPSTEDISPSTLSMSSQIIPALNYLKPWIAPVVQPGAPLPNKLNPRDADKQLGHVLLLAADGQLQAHLVIKIIDQQSKAQCSLCIRHQSAASAGQGFLLH